MLEGPLAVLVVDDAEGVELIFGEEIFGIVVFFGHLQSAEEVVRLADGDNGVSGPRARLATFLLDLMPSDRQRHDSNK